MSILTGIIIQFKGVHKFSKSHKYITQIDINEKAKNVSIKFEKLLTWYPELFDLKPLQNNCCFFLQINEFVRYNVTATLMDSIAFRESIAKISIKSSQHQKSALLSPKKFCIEHINARQQQSPAARIQMS